MRERKKSQGAAALRRGAKKPLKGRRKSTSLRKSAADSSRPARARAGDDEAPSRYAALFDFSPVGYFVLDGRGLIRQANPSGASLLGSEPGRVIEQPFDRFVAPGDRRLFAAFLTRLRNAGDKQTCELKLRGRARDSCLVHVEATCAGPLKVEEEGCLLAVTDVTSRRRAELELQASRDELERTAGRMAREVAFEKLIARLSSNFINVPAGEVDRQIEDAQRSVCESLELDASALWQCVVGNPNVYRLSHLHRPQGGPPPPERMDAQRFLPWCQRQLVAGNVVAVSSMDALPPEAARDQEVWRERGIKSTLLLPLSTGEGPVIGFLSFGTLRSERTWPDELLKRLELVAQIFTNAIARKRAADELRDTEARLDLAVEWGGTGLWSLDLESLRVWANTRAHEMLPLDPEHEITYEGFLEVVHPEDREAVRRAVERACQTDAVLDVDYRILLPDGSLRWISAHGRPYRVGAGDSGRLMGVSIDVTARKQAEAVLRENEARLASAIDAAALGFYELDGVGRIAFLDDRVRAFLGVPEGEDHLAREYWSERLHPDDRQRVLDFRRDVLTGALDRNAAEYRYQHPDLGLLWLHHLLHVVERDGAGRPVRLIGVLQDITSRKRNEEKIRESEEFGRNVLSSLVDGVVILDHDGTILAVNEEWERLATENGAPEPPAGARVGANYLEICRRAAAQEVLGGIRSVLAGTTDFFRLESSLPLPAGTRWFLMRVMPLRRPGGGAVIAHADITERKNAEMELQQLRLQLWHADRVAQTGAVTASLAHEVNQPLAAILSNAQAGLRFMAGDNPDFGEIRDILADIVRDDKRAASVISGLRAMLRRKVTDRARISLADTIRGIFRMLNSELVDQHVELRLQLESGGFVSADQAQIQQVLLNLVMNAVEAMEDLPDSQRRLDVTLTHTDTGGARVAIRDSGPGVPEEQREKLFEAFLTTKQHGMGIGLPISRSIIESHGGHLWFENNPDQGVTFYFTLPLLETGSPSKGEVRD